MPNRRGLFASCLLALWAAGSVLAQSVPQTDPQPDPTETLAEDAANQSHNVAVLRALDKITARITELDVPVGEEARFGTLALKVRYCRTRPPIEPPETFAYVEIDDLKRGGDRERVFEGWMVASSPALNALEHPVYDVWVINCKTVSPETDGPSS